MDTGLTAPLGVSAELLDEAAATRRVRDCSQLRTVERSFVCERATAMIASSFQYEAPKGERSGRSQIAG